MLIELLYTSAAREEMTQDALRALLETSRRNNAETGITGLLVYHRQSFMQLLEGEEEMVMRLYSRILDDPRHTGSRVLWKGPIAERTFGQWTMAFKRLSELEPAELEGYSQFLEHGFAGEPDGDVESVARSLLTMLSDNL